MAARLHRTALYVETVEDDILRCIVGGMPAPELRAQVPVGDLPAALRADVEPGKVFFAHANLAAQTPEEMVVKDIEDRWGCDRLARRAIFPSGR